MMLGVGGSSRAAFRNVKRASPLPRHRRGRGGAARPAVRILDYDLVPRSSRSLRLRREHTGVEIVLVVAALLAVVVGAAYAMWHVLA